MDAHAVSFLTRAVLALSAMFFSYDIASDLLEGEGSVHVAVELLVCCLVVFALGREILNGFRLRRSLEQHRMELSQIRSGFAQTIREQFQRWQLTQSETEIAWLIIKGFSFAEIARLRGVREKTVRQQATAIYAKSGTENRNDLTALFIEDLLNPETRAA